MILWPKNVQNCHILVENMRTRDRDATRGRKYARNIIASHYREQFYLTLGPTPVFLNPLELF
jgi:hypothetical protein